MNPRTAFANAVLAARVSERFRTAEVDPVGQVKKHGEWNLAVYKDRSRWSYFMTNPQGGGGGTGAYSNMRSAIGAGLSSVDWATYGKGKTKVWLILAEWDPEAENYLVKKTDWLPIPKDLLEKAVKPRSKEEAWEEMTR